MLWTRPAPQPYNADGFGGMPRKPVRVEYEVENNWAGDISQIDTERDQDRAVFRQRRAQAFQAMYEHLPYRIAHRPGTDRGGVGVRDAPHKSDEAGDNVP